MAPKIERNAEIYNCVLGCGSPDCGTHHPPHPHHKFSYKRVVRNIRAEEGKCRVKTSENVYRYKLIGEAKLPWGKETVVKVFSGGRLENHWDIVKEFTDEEPTWKSDR